MAYDKLLTLVQLLRDRTANGKVNWEQTSEDGVFQAAFPQYSVQIFSRSTRHRDEGREGLDYVLGIFNAEGALVEEADDLQLATTITGANRLMRELHDAARRKAMGVDDALDAIIGALGKDEDIPF